MNFKPIRTEILLEYVENKPVGGVIMPNSESFDYSMFVVRAVGEGILTNNGYVELPVKVGDRVKLKATAKGNLSPIEPWLVDDAKLAVIGIEHVLGVWEGELPPPKTVRNILKANGQALVH